MPADKHQSEENEKKNLHQHSPEDTSSVHTSSSMDSSESAQDESTLPETPLPSSSQDVPETPQGEADADIKSDEQNQSDSVSKPISEEEVQPSDSISKPTAEKEQPSEPIADKEPAQEAQETVASSSEEQPTEKDEAADDETSEEDDEATVTFRKPSLAERITATVQAIRLNKSDKNGNHHKTDFSEFETVVMPVPKGVSSNDVLTKDPSQRINMLPATLTHTGGTGPQSPLAAQRRRSVLVRHMSRKHMRQSREKESNRFRRVGVAVICTFLAFLVVFLSVSGVGSYLYYRFYNDTQTKFGGKVTNLRDALPKDNLKIYDRNGVMISQMLEENMQSSIPLDQVSKDLINATVAIEDKSFWTNSGVDFGRIISAAIENLKAGHAVEGGSTITQQLIKNMVVGDQRDALRKLQEIVLTPQINSQFTKAEILEMYLNTIPYGTGKSSATGGVNAIGINAAAQMYFGLKDTPEKSAASQLSLAQAAMLAGVPNAPTIYNPYINIKEAKKRMAIVLELMVRSGYINNAKAQAALKEAEKPDFLKPGSFIFNNRAPHFSEFVIRELTEQYKTDKSTLSRSGMEVYTTLDLKLQEKVVKLAKEHITNIKGTNNISNAAGVIIDQHTGAIVTLFGSIDPYDKSIEGQFDVATLGFRQPGSSFKPYVYAAAMEKGASPGQAIDDNQLIIPLPGGNPPTYEPKNYDRLYHGQMTMRCALQNSLNIPAVKTLEYVGIQEAFNKAKSAGLETIKGTPGYAMVLGGLDVNLLQHTSAFGSFGNGGVHVPYYAIEKITFDDKDEKPFQHKKNPGKRVWSEQVAFMISDVLSDNISRYPQFGNCSPLYLYNYSEADCYAGNTGQVHKAAVKTGTTDNFVDNWTMGYTTDYVMGVWAGNNNNSPMNDKSTGITGAAPIWHDAMLLAEEGKPIREFQQPGGVQKLSVTYPNGVNSIDWVIDGKYPVFNKPAPQPNPSPTADPKAQKKAPAAAVPYCRGINYTSKLPASTTWFDMSRGWW